MAIQPIDLQNMYSQISNVAKSVGGAQQSAAISQSIQQQAVAQKINENAQKVQSASNEKSNTNDINADGKNNNPGRNPEKQKKPEKDNSGLIQNISRNEVKASYLGTIVDITR